ncbi:cardiolipin synthase [Noviherbaspirillum massiliense]|uniref:cardiolipin synthase n=1 Tax=Noviherbaspirillum massiliense TaxID=1465823 RepID=UPI000313373A|nr:cardiolipin synthase [Noviherbaspirillum massiliense]
MKRRSWLHLLSGLVLRHGWPLLLLPLAACATLPDVSYLRDEELIPRNRPQIADGQGTLPAGKSQALLSRLKAQVDPTAILTRHIKAEEAISNKPLVAGNKVTLLDDGPQTMRAMLAAIREARRHIHLETYIFEDDEVGRALADLLIRKHAEGVQVSVIYDSVGTLDTPREFFERLRAAGIGLLEFNPVNPMRAHDDWEINQRDHRKILIVDGRIAFTGGVNISRVYGKSALLGSKSGKPPKDPKQAVWRDTHMQIEGPAVGEIQKLFLETWRLKTGTALPDADFFPPLKPQGQALVRAIGSIAEKEDYTIYKTYISAFANASNYIHLTTAYFSPDRQVVDALIDAAHRGVDVQIVFPSFSDNSFMVYASRSYYQELLDAGIRVYERQGAMLHAKTAVIDDVWSTIGSTNIDIRSFLHNDEVNAVVLDIGFARQMEALFQRDVRESVEVSRERWAQRGVTERLREWGVRMFNYWL